MASKQPKSPTINGEICAKLRHQLGLSQGPFWQSLGATQSAGSRYESGRAIPKPLKKLIFVTHLAKDKLNADQLAAIAVVN